jgi:hypothetical protein
VCYRQTREGACHELPADSHSLSFAAINDDKTFYGVFSRIRLVDITSFGRAFTRFQVASLKALARPAMDTDAVCEWEQHIRAKRQGTKSW